MSECSTERGMIMKRFICALLILCLLPVLTFAEDYDYVTTYFDIVLDNYGCQEFPQEYMTTKSEDGSEIRHFFITKDVKIAIKTNGKTTSELSASCFDESQLHDFFVACYSCLTVFNVSATSAANAVFFSYLEAKNGESKLNSFGTSIYSKMIYYPDEEKFTFVVMKVENR